MQGETVLASAVFAFVSFELIITLEGRNLVSGNKTCDLFEIECAESRSEVRICPARLDFELWVIYSLTFRVFLD